MKRCGNRWEIKWAIGVLFLSPMLLFSPVTAFTDEVVEDGAIKAEDVTTHASTGSKASDSKRIRKTEKLNEAAVAAIAASVVTEGAAITPSISNQTGAPSIK